MFDIHTTECPACLGLMPRSFDLKMEGCHIVEEPGADEVVRASPGLGAVRAREVEEAGSD